MADAMQNQTDSMLWIKRLRHSVACAGSKNFCTAQNAWAPSGDAPNPTL